LVLTPDVVLRPVKSVQRFPLGEHRRLRRVQILGLSRSQDSSAKSDVAAHRIQNREHEAAAKAWARLASVLALYEEASRREARFIETEGGHVVPKQTDLARSESDAELVRDFARYVALRQIITGLGAERIVPQNLLEVRRGGRVHFP